nr:DUF792 family protein [Borrelia sp. BU AG58]
MLEKTTLLIKEIVNQILSLSSASNFIALFPRPDFKGLAYLPQVFLYFQKKRLLRSI